MFQFKFPIPSDTDTMLYHNLSQFIAIYQPQVLMAAFRIFTGSLGISACGHKYPFNYAMRVHGASELADFIGAYARIRAISFCLKVDFVQAKHVFGDDAVYGAIT